MAEFSGLVEDVSAAVVSEPIIIGSASEASSSNARSKLGVEEENKLYAVYHKNLEKGRVFAEPQLIRVDELLIRIANGFLKIRDVHQSQIDVLVQSFKDAGINPTDLVMRAVVRLNGRDLSTSESRKQLEEDIRTGVCEIMPFTGIHRYHALQKYDVDCKNVDPDYVKQSKMFIHIYDFDKIDMCDAMFVGTKDNEVRLYFCFLII